MTSSTRAAAGAALAEPGTSTMAAFRAVSRRLPEPVELLDALPRPTGALAFVGAESALVGWGEFARFTTRGPDAADQIAAWFAELSRSVTIDAEPDLPGLGGLHAFVSLGFDDSDTSVAVVPTTLLARRNGVTFGTSLTRRRPEGSGRGPAETLPGMAEPEPVVAPGRIRYSDASFSVAGFTAAVTAAKARIRAGELDKVVLAHDLDAVAETDIDERFLLRRLHAAYPSCWTYAVDGLVGASPEMMIRRVGATVTSRVLAGTAWAGDRTISDVAGTLMSSSKNRSEHRFAVASVAETLTPLLASIAVPEQPHPLVLANLTHLATDITGTLPAGERPTALALAARLHPTAAVGGTPTWRARQLIRELEPEPRGRYAAPVGWLDAAGDGEFAIALRCAQVSGRSVRLRAGCGIVADSDPEVEAREAAVKMIPVRDALESPPVSPAPPR